MIRQRARLAWNRITRGQNRSRRMIGALLAIGLTFGFIVLAGLNTGLLVDRIARTDPDAAVQILPVLLIAVTLLTLVTSLASAFHHLFLAGDLELLLVAPVPSRSLFALKTLEIWRDSLHIILFQGAALYGFGQSLHLPFTYYVAAVCGGLLLTLSASAFGATLSLALAHIRFGESILGVSRLLALMLFLPIGVLGVPSIGFGRLRGALLFDQGSVGAITTQLQNLGPPPTWAPTTWAAHVLLGDESAPLSLALLLSTAAIAFSTMQLAFDAQFQNGWERVRFSAPRSITRRKRQLRLSVPTPGGAIGGLLLKDWRTVARDPRWRTGTLFSLVALAIPAVLLFAGDPFARSGHTLRFWFSMLPVPYLAYLFGSQQGASTLIYEGRNLALLRSAPVRMSRILTGKILGGLGLVLGVTWAATVAVGVTHSGEPVEMLEALLAATWLALGSTVSAVSSAALTADFEGDNPQRRIGCLGTLITSALSIFFFVANSALLGWWVARGALAIPRQLIAVVPVMDWGLPVLVVLSVGAIMLALRQGTRRLAAWETS